MASVTPTLTSYPSYGHQRARPSWLRLAILVVLCCLFLPRGVEFQIGTIMVDASRCFLALFAIIATRGLLTGSIKLRATPADALMAVHVGVVALSAAYHSGLGEGLETSIAVLVDMGLAYFVARVAVNSLSNYRYYVRIVLIIAAISAVFGLFEMLTPFSFVRAAYHAFFPQVPSVHLHNQRLSLYRATATFRADILFGLYCMSAFSLAVGMLPRDLSMRPAVRRLCLVLCVLGVFSSLSSGPWLALTVCFFLVVYERLMRSVRIRWKLLLAVVGMILLFLSVATNRGPFRLIIDYLTLDPLSGYIRLAMYEAVWALVPDYWPLGWGWGGDWPRPEWYTWTSIDCFYAVTFVRAGLFAVLSLIGFLAYSLYALSRHSARCVGPTREANGWIRTTVCLFLVAITVDIFGNLVFAVYFMLGAGQGLLEPPRPAARPSRIVQAAAARAP